MNNWKKIKIEEVCSFINGYAFDSNKYVQNGIQVIRITNVQKGYISDTDKKFYKEEKELERYKLIEGDLLISLTGNVGRVGVIKSENLPAYLNQRVSCVRIKNNNLLNKRFLFNFLNSDSFEKTCIKNSKGIAQKNISTVWLREIKIPLPAMEEQRKIAQRLDAVSDLLAKQKQLLSEQDNLIQSTFYDMFGDHQLSQQKGQWNNISDVAVVAGGSTPKTQTPEYWDGDLNWFTPAELENCSWYVYSSQRKITTAGVKSCHLEEFPINTVLLSSRAPIGKLAIARETFYCNQGFKNIISAETVNQIYLYHLLMYNINYMKSLGKGATFKEISKKIVEDIKIPVPPLELQEKFAAIVKQIESEKSKIKSAIAETQTLFNALMSEYFEE